MAVVLANKHEKEAVEMRAALCETLMQLAETREDIVYLDADSFGSSGMKKFAKAYPDRAFDVGIAEANMIGVAAGMSATGKTPFVHSFGPFATRRCFDQLFLSVAYGRNTVNVIGSDPGITALYNGGTHMPFEDVGIMRNIPTAIIVEPTDTTMLRSVVRDLSEKRGLHYIRLKRKTAIKVYEEGTTFTIGKGITIREGSDVTLIAAGIMVSEALAAAEQLAVEGISARVIDMFTLKPIDAELIKLAAAETGAIVTCENHSVINGLGSAVAEVLVQNTPRSHGDGGCAGRVRRGGRRGLPQGAVWPDSCQHCGKGQGSSGTKKVKSNPDTGKGRGSFLCLFVMPGTALGTLLGRADMPDRLGSARSATNGNLLCPVEQSVQPEQGSTRTGPALV